LQQYPTASTIRIEPCAPLALRSSRAPLALRSSRALLARRSTRAPLARRSAPTDDAARGRARDPEPPLFEFPRDAVSLVYLGYGMVFTAVNVVGAYDDYETVVLVALLLGTASALAMVGDALDPPPLPAIDAAEGYVSRRTITRFGAAYMVAAMWVCFRTSPSFAALVDARALAGAPGLHALDVAANLLAAAVFAWGVAAPVAGALAPPSSPPRTATQTLLLRGSIAQNVIGCTFLPVVLAMALRGPLWWDAVHERWPLQTLLEPSTSTFAGLSVDAGLLFLRLAARGRLTWPQVVTLGVSSSVALAVVPCAAFLAYNDGLFDWFSLYSIPRSW
jgi:hypothetical protein